MVQRLAPFKLDVIVVGGAISGLSTALGLALSGHKVRVLEKSPAFGEPPGGIRIPPNVTKILVGWGLEEELRKRAHLPREGTDLWDFETGKLVGYLEWAEPIMQDSGAAYYQMRYSDLHEILYDAATRAGAEVILNADVRLASPPAQGSSASGKPSVQLRDGTVLHADMIVGADGQHSTMRTSIEVKHVEPQATNTLVFTANIPMKRLLEDEVLAKFETTWVYWFGPRRACVGYPIAHGREYAVHLYWDRQDPNEPEGWIPNLPVRSLNLSETALDDRLARMFEKIDAVCWQKYLDWPSIENWSDDSSRIVLVGESSRPTVVRTSVSCSAYVMIIPRSHAACKPLAYVWRAPRSSAHYFLTFADSIIFRFW
jgi:salicylate hydroxylase